MKGTRGSPKVSSLSVRTFLLLLFCTIVMLLTFDRVQAAPAECGTRTNPIRNALYVSFQHEQDGLELESTMSSLLCMPSSASSNEIGFEIVFHESININITAIPGEDTLPIRCEDDICFAQFLNSVITSLGKYGSHTLKGYVRAFDPVTEKTIKIQEFEEDIYVPEGTYRYIIHWLEGVISELPHQALIVLTLSVVGFMLTHLRAKMRGNMKYRKDEIGSGVNEL